MNQQEKRKVELDTFNECIQEAIQENQDQGKLKVAKFEEKHLQVNSLVLCQGTRRGCNVHVLWWPLRPRVHVLRITTSPNGTTHSSTEPAQWLSLTSDTPKIQGHPISSSVLAVLLCVPHYSDDNENTLGFLWFSHSAGISKTHSAWPWHAGIVIRMLPVLSSPRKVRSPGLKPFLPE